MGYPERDKTNGNVLDVSAWDFYVVSTATLNQEFGETKSLSLSAVRQVAVVSTQCFGAGPIFGRR